MKLVELGLKTKPATKYFDGGYYKFLTVNGELWYEVHYVKKSGTGLCWSDRVKDNEQLGQMMKVKTMQEAVNQ